MLRRLNRINLKRARKRRLEKRGIYRRFFHRMQRNWCDECRDEPESGLSVLACLSPFFPPTYPQGCTSSNAVLAHAVFIWNVWELQLPTNRNGSVAIASPYLHCPRPTAGL